jgi:hypothetical protein
MEVRVQRFVLIFSSLDNLQEQSPHPRLRYTTATTKTFWFFWFWMLKTDPNRTKPVLGSVRVILTRTIIFRFDWIFVLKPDRTGSWTPLVLLIEFFYIYILSIIFLLKKLDIYTLRYWVSSSYIVIHHLTYLLFNIK